MCVVFLLSSFFFLFYFFLLSTKSTHAKILTFILKSTDRWQNQIFYKTDVNFIKNKELDLSDFKLGPSNRGFYFSE